jgi:Glycosyltransferase like family 2
MSVDPLSASVVIPTSGRPDLLGRVIAPHLREPAADEVIVVVDSVRDGSLELLQRMAESEPRLMPLFVEAGSEMGARQAGLEAATGDVVVFVDDDVVAKPGLARGHARRHEDAGDLVVLGPMPVAPAQRERGFAARLYASVYDSHMALWDERPDELLLHFWAGNFSMRRERALALGLDGSGFQGRYHPDYELGLRCHKAGLRGVWSRELAGQHLYERTPAQFVRDCRRQGASHVLLHQSHPDLLSAPARDGYERGLAPPLRLVVRAARRQPLERMTSRVLLDAARIADRAGRTGLALKLAFLLKRVENQAGALAVLDGRAGSDLLLPLSSAPARS